MLIAFPKVTMKQHRALLLYVKEKTRVPRPISRPSFLKRPTFLSEVLNTAPYIDKW
jgi:hypothetical protein